ncbi:Uncharacterized protein Rs2_09795 [Raphanus sativus]|nr:Uncharacterized protein Rs2_09795 [Raphanus sativus]
MQLKALRIKVLQGQEDIVNAVRKRGNKGTHESYPMCRSVHVDIYKQAYMCTSTKVYKQTCGYPPHQPQLAEIEKKIRQESDKEKQQQQGRYAYNRSVLSSRGEEGLVCKDREDNGFQSTAQTRSRWRSGHEQELGCYSDQITESRSVAIATEPRLQLGHYSDRAADKARSL